MTRKWYEIQILIFQGTCETASKDMPGFAMQVDGLTKKIIDISASNESFDVSIQKCGDLNLFLQCLIWNGWIKTAEILQNDNRKRRKSCWNKFSDLTIFH